MKTFGFGEERGDCHIVNAQNIDVAIKIFKIEVLYPEQYVSKKFVKKYKYNHNLKINEYEFKNNPQIKIYAVDEDHNYKFIKNISLYDCINVEYSSGKINSNLLTYEKNSNEEEDEKQEVFDVAIINEDIEQKDITQYNKVELRKINSALVKKMAELEAARYELKEMQQKLQVELKQKTKMLYIIETYLGINEEVYRLQEGKPAPEKEPLTIFQLKLYMDEEIGLWDDQGLDYTEIEQFDKWLLKDKKYKTFLHKEQSICAFQVRRNEKDYGDPFENMQNYYNKMTYFLIRNGENLYRIWSDVNIPEKMFPTLSEYDNIMNDDWNKNSTERAKKEIQKKHEHYMYGMIAVQGMIERTDVFNSYLKTVNLLKINGFTEEQVHLIRDGESNTFITDGQLTWYEFLKKNQKSISLGTRVVVLERQYSSKKDNQDWRTAPFYFDSPKLDTLYQVEKTKETHPEEVGGYWGARIMIYFKPNNRYYFDDEEKKHRRIPFRMDESEVINYDAITLEECEYYEKNRLERKNYIRILPVIHWIKKLKEEERRVEDEFIKFINGKIGNKFSEKKIRNAVQWWKLKNKWKRDVLDDGSKAVRMVIRKLNNQDIKK